MERFPSNWPFFNETVACQERICIFYQRAPAITITKTEMRTLRSMSTTNTLNLNNIFQVVHFFFSVSLPSYRTGGSRIFFRRGCTRLLLYFNTNKPHSFFGGNTSCIRKLQVISGGVRTPCTLPLDPPLYRTTKG